ncbi:MAG: phosphotransferase [Bacteroidales bacterium]|nr:phosphotransferase [Bacteroidales bacterium]
MSLESLFERYAGAEPVSCVALTGSASHRRYYRLTGPDGRTLIGVEGTDADENRAFLTIDRHFASKGINVPEVVAEDGLCYLQEDLGSTVLYDALSAGRKSGSYSPEEVLLLKKTIAALPKIQVEGARGLDFSVCYPQPSFDARMVDFDLNYLKYDFLKLTGLEFNEVFLQDDFDRLRADLLAEPSDTFLYRDFNARNVMLVGGEPYFIDFQGGRRGPVYYDVASFLWQARARSPEALREELLQVYLDALRAYGPVDETRFRERLRLFILVRMLQVLGCYGFRGLWEGNKAFSDSIPPALEIVQSLLPFQDYPYLSEVLTSISEGSRKHTPSEEQKEKSELTVTIYSFSYRKGIPEDASGNGGGYVFDCRSVHNPGKYERFKQLTGLDAPVIKFLEEDGEILRFLDHVYALVDAHVERFLERGFTHLQVSFGCTGGQHRSAYSAQHLAEHLASKYPVKVHLIHRERGIEQWL